MAVYRIYVEKKPKFAVEARLRAVQDLKTSLLMDSVKSVRILNRYDVENIDETDFENAKHTVFSEPQVDTISAGLPVISPKRQDFCGGISAGTVRPASRLLCPVYPDFHPDGPSSWPAPLGSTSSPAPFPTGSLPRLNTISSTR